MVVVIELVRRCAWCGRVVTAEGWQDDDSSGDYQGCVEAAGISHPIDHNEAA